MIVVNMDKAKEIGHDIRRVKRDEAFAPYDKVIELQIPGEDAAAAEAERVKIREQNELTKQAINDATTPDEIKAALGIGE
jgi:hypothetical protein